MKTQNDDAYICGGGGYCPSTSVTGDVLALGLLRSESVSVLVQGALKNYRENRENGAEQDNPKRPFPSAEFYALNIKKSSLQSYSKWPDKQGRRWWKLTLDDGGKNKDFYWAKDDVRGYPDKNDKDRYWFIVHYAPTGTKMEGFALEPDRAKGFPDTKKRYWHRVVFTDTENPAIRAWMAEKDLNYLDRIQKENPALYNQEIADLKRQNDPNSILPQHEARQRERGVVIGGEPKKQAVSVASKKEGKEKKEKRKKKEESVKKKSSRRRHLETESALPDVPKGKVKVIHAYLSPPDSDHLSLSVGNVLDLRNDEGNWWQCCNERGEVGLVPSNHVVKVSEVVSPMATLPLAPVVAGESPFPPPVNRLQLAQQAAAKLQVSSPSWSDSGSASPSPLHSGPEEETPPRKGSTIGVLDNRGTGQVDMLLNHADLIFGKRLGEGGFGEVCRGDWLGTDVAIKKLLQRKLTAKLEQEFRHEAGVMVQLRHPNVLTLYGIVLVPEACMVLEFMAKGSLYDVLHSQTPMSWQMRYQIGLDAAKGLVYLHGKHILHRDLKSLNVLLDKDYQAKLADFGLSKIKVSSSQTHNAGIAGTTQWIAPELFSEDKPRYTPACDVYSYAMVLWELMSRQVPFHEIGNRSLIPVRVMQGKREAIPPNSPESLKVLLVGCWAQQPEGRPKMKAVVSELKAHPVTDNTPIPSPHSHTVSSASSSSSMWYDDSMEQSSDVARSKTPGQVSPGVSPPPVSTGWFDSATPAPMLSPSVTPKTGQPKREQTHDSGWWMQSGTGSAEGQRGGASRGGQVDSGYVGISVSSSSGSNLAIPESRSSMTMFKSSEPRGGVSSASASGSAPQLGDDKVVYKAVAKGDYKARDARQLSFMKGDKLTVIEKQPSGWWVCELNGKQGLTPGSWLQMVEPEAPQQQASGESSSSMSSGYV